MVDQVEANRAPAIPAPGLSISGYYGEVGYFLTGEERPYSAARGAWTTVNPVRPLSFSGDGWGAFEIAGRYSVADLNSGSPLQGRRHWRKAVDRPDRSQLVPRDQYPLPARRPHRWRRSNGVGWRSGGTDRRRDQSRHVIRGRRVPDPGQLIGGAPRRVREAYLSRCAPYRRREEKRTRPSLWKRNRYRHRVRNRHARRR